MREGVLTDLRDADTEIDPGNAEAEIDLGVRHLGHRLGDRGQGGICRFRACRSGIDAEDVSTIHLVELDSESALVKVSDTVDFVRLFILVCRTCKAAVHDDLVARIIDLASVHDGRISISADRRGGDEARLVGIGGVYEIDPAARDLYVGVFVEIDLAVAALEGAVADRPQCGGQSHTRQILTILEGLRLDLGDALRQGDGSESAVHKGAHTDLTESREDRVGNADERARTAEGVITDALDCALDADLGEASRIFKEVVGDHRHALGEHDGGDRSTRKGTFADIGQLARLYARFFIIDGE